MTSRMKKFIRLYLGTVGSTPWFINRLQLRRMKDMSERIKGIIRKMDAERAEMGFVSLRWPTPPFAVGENRVRFRKVYK